MVNKAEFAKKLRDAIPEKTTQAVEREAFLRELKSTTAVFFVVIKSVGTEYGMNITSTDLYEWAKTLQVELKNIFHNKNIMCVHPAPRYVYKSNLGLEVTVNRSQLWFSEINGIIYVCVDGVSVDPALGVPDRE